MTTLLQIGIAYAAELDGIGHVACTLGGVNYESRGGIGCLKGSAARGATSPLFRHHYYTALGDDQAQTAKRYADSCVGQPYVWDAVPAPGHGGDCSGFVSAIICAAEAKPIHRVFSTGDWIDVAGGLGFRTGLGGGVTPDADAAGVADRPYPGYPILEGSDKADHIRWIQARLNYAAGDHHAVIGGAALAVDGEFGPLTLKVTEAFQGAHGLPTLGRIGPDTWGLLNRVR